MAEYPVTSSSGDRYGDPLQHLTVFFNQVMTNAPLLLGIVTFWATSYCAKVSALLLKARLKHNWFHVVAGRVRHPHQHLQTVVAKMSEVYGINGAISDTYGR